MMLVNIGPVISLENSQNKQSRETILKICKEPYDWSLLKAALPSCPWAPKKTTTTTTKKKNEQKQKNKQKTSEYLSLQNILESLGFWTKVRMSPD